MSNEPEKLDVNGSSEDFPFVDLCLRTESDGFHPEHVHRISFLDTLQEFVESGKQLDRYKRLLFYGVNDAKGVKADEVDTHWDSLKALIADRDQNEETARLLHAVLGIATEAAEMVEAVEKALNEHTPIDHVNMVEESGDVMYYQGLLAKWAGVKLLWPARVVIYKLQKRFSDKFSSQEAYDRDLKAERGEMENRIT